MMKDQRIEYTMTECEVLEACTAWLIAKNEPVAGDAYIKQECMPYGSLTIVSQTITKDKDH